MRSEGGWGPRAEKVLKCDFALRAFHRNSEEWYRCLAICSLLPVCTNLFKTPTLTQTPAHTMSAFEVGDEHGVIITANLNCLELSAHSLPDEYVMHRASLKKHKKCFLDFL